MIFINKKKYFYLFIFLFILFFYFLNKYNKFGLSKTSYSILSFCFNIRSIVNRIGFFISNDENNIYNKYKELENDYNSLQNKYFTISYLKDCLNLTRDYILDGKTFDRNSLPASILMMKNNSTEQYFVINRGLVDKINNGMAVSVGTFLLGRVTRILEHYSDVIMITNSNLKIAVKFEKTNIKGIVQGCGNKDFLQAFYVQDPENKIEEGQLVYTSGEGMIFPAGYVVGKVKEVIRDSNLYVTVIIKTICDFDNIEYCNVLTDSYIENISESINYLQNSYNPKILKNELKNKIDENNLNSKKNIENSNLESTKKEYIEEAVKKNKDENSNFKGIECEEEDDEQDEELNDEDDEEVENKENDNVNKIKEIEQDNNNKKEAIKNNNEKLEIENLNN
jgi:rod shape-determining protein MreC